MTDEELKETYTLFSELWKMVKRYHDSRTDDEWAALVDAADRMVKKHGEESRMLVLETLGLIERRCKQ